MWVGGRRRIADQRAAKAIVLEGKACTRIFTGEIKCHRIAARIADREPPRGARAGVALAGGGEIYINEIDPLAGVGAEAEDSAAQHQSRIEALRGVAAGKLEDTGAAGSEDDVDGVLTRIELDHTVAAERRG